MQIRLHHRSGFVVMTTITFPPSLYHRSAIIIVSGFWGFFRHHLFPALPLTVGCRAVSWKRRLLFWILQTYPVSRSHFTVSAAVSFWR